MMTYDAVEETLCEQQIKRLRVLARLFWNVIDREALATLDLSAFDGMGEKVTQAQAALAHDAQRALEDEEVARNLRVEFTTLFASPRLNAPLPYESLFVHEGGLLMQDARDEAVRRYRHAGFSVDWEGHEPEDHLSVELLYLAHLEEQALSAQREGCNEKRDKALAEAASFKRDHIAQWIPHFCDSVARTAETDFYQGALTLLESCVQGECS